MKIRLRKFWIEHYLEPYIPVLLIIHGIFELEFLYHPYPDWLFWLLVIPFMVLTTTLLPKFRTETWQWIRVATLLITGYIFQIFTGGAQSYFLFWFFVLVVSYTCLISSQRSLFISFAAAVSYAFLGVFEVHEIPHFVIFTRSFLILFTGWVIWNLKTSLLRDIEVRKNIEKKLRNSRNAILSLIEASPLAIFVLNRQGEVKTFWNPAATRLFGYSREEVICKKLPTVPESETAQFESLLQTVISGESLLGKELVRKKKDGTLIDIMASAAPFRDPEGNTKGVLVLSEDITEKKRNRKQLEQALSEKQVLLKEIHHRVKNNLAVIVSLIELQLDKLEQQQLKLILQDIQSRIYTIALIHEQLYKFEDFTEIDYKEFVTELTGFIENHFNYHNKEIEVLLELQDIRLNINQGIPLGLVINELLINSYEHAFKDRVKGKVYLALNYKSGEILLHYEDDGSGIPSQINIDSSETLGLTLIRILLSQLEADWEIHTDDGFNINISFSAENGKGSATLL